MAGSKVDFVKLMARASKVITVLSTERVVVCAVTLVGGVPVIRVKPCAYCDRLVHQGKAFYMEFGAGAFGRYRQGQYRVGGCKVVWSESLH